MSTRTNRKSSGAASGYPPLSREARVFLGLLAGVSVLYFAILVYHLSVPRAPAADLTTQNDLWERCRKVCLSYGLLPTGHIANDAEAYLKATQSEELSGALYEILDDKDFAVVESQAHGLLGNAAPPFELPDETGTVRAFQELSEDGASVVVFYYGYGCSHCVAQLFALDKDLQYFRQLGFQVLAISADSPEYTTKQFTKYGRFHFPVLSDKDNLIAEKYGVFIRGAAGGEDSLNHGTFVIDRTGKIVWAYQGTQPFLDNKSLLLTAAKAQGLLPTKKQGPAP